MDVHGVIMMCPETAHKMLYMDLVKLSSLARKKIS